MNMVMLIGRLTRDPEIRYTEMGVCIARYTLAVDRISKDKEADFISCVAYADKGEFAEKYMKKGMKMAISGRLRTGKYEKDDGTTVYTTDVVANVQEFCESKKNTGRDLMDDEAAGEYGGFEKTEEDLPFS